MSTIFCVVIDKLIAGPRCPLPTGSCMWKHRQTSDCTYDEQFASLDFTVNEYAARVGLPTPDPEVLVVMRNSLTARVKSEIIG